jgi:hypothetical protein
MFKLKHILFVMFGVLALGGFGLALSSVLTSDLGGNTPAPASEQTQPQATYPSGTSAQNIPVPIPQNTMEITTKDGSVLHVRDVRKSAVFQGTDPDGGGRYFTLVATPPANASDEKGYIIAFMEKLETFNIAITGEPFEKKQQDAERDLQSRLDIPQEDFCRLRFYITVVHGGTFIERGEPLVCQQ